MKRGVKAPQILFVSLKKTSVARKMMKAFSSLSNKCANNSVCMNISRQTVFYRPAYTKNTILYWQNSENPALYSTIKNVIFTMEDCLRVVFW